MEHVLTMANLKLKPSLFMPHPNTDQTWNGVLYYVIKLFNQKQEIV